MTLIARYKLDGNAKDSAGTAHGTAIDVTWAPSQLVDGGGEARFNGSTSRIDTGITFTTETAASLPVWLRPGKGAGHLIGQHDGTDGLAIEQTETGKIRLVVGATASAAFTVYPGEYHHAMAAYDAGTATLYLDNEAVASVTATVTWPAVPVTIGARADGNAALECDVVDLKAYDHALNENEINHLSNSIDIDNPSPTYTKIPTAGLVAFYTMEVMAGNEVHDETNTYPITYSGPGLVPGKFSQGLKFRGSSYGDVGSIPGGIPLDKVTISLWVFPEVTDSQRPIIANWNSSGLSWILDISYGNVRWITRDGANTTIQQAAITAGEWTHIFAKTDETGTGTLILNNGTPAIGAAKYPLQYPGGIIYFGIKGDGASAGLAGILDQIRIYDTDLDNSEAEALYNDHGGETGLLAFPYVTSKRAATPILAGQLGYNPFAIPRLPNETVIPASGRSTVQDTPDTFDTLGWFDQRDGSGRDRMDLNGVVSDPTRQGVIEGNITDENGNPVSRRVRAFERLTGRLVREAWSNQAGYYRFADLDPGLRFTILAHDHTGVWNAVVADNVQSEIQ